MLLLLISTRGSATAYCRLDLPVPLPAPAFISMTQPGRNGGLGLRLRSCIAPAAKWASAAIVAPDLAELASRIPKLPFVVDREFCHGLLRTAGVRSSDVSDQIEAPIPGEGEPGSSGPSYTLPTDPANIAIHYQGEPRIRCLQRSTTLLSTTSSSLLIALKKTALGSNAAPGPRANLL